jgi:hypothetical protein
MYVIAIIYCYCILEHSENSKILESCSVCDVQMLQKFEAGES